MREAISNEFVYEILKKIQADVAHLKGVTREQEQRFIALRDQIHNMNRNLQTQLHDVRGDVLRIEKHMVAIGPCLERIERRLELPIPEGSPR
jgi:hypothetical protein